MKISEQAVVSKNSKIGQGVEIGPFAIIEDDVEIGQDVKIWPHAYIASGSSIGDNCRVHMGAVIGHIPQDMAFKDKKSYVKIGRNTVIREYATVHRGTAENSSTVIGDDCYLMAVSHVGHNCSIGKGVIIANCALLAGYVTVGDYAFISGNVVMHQYCRIGTLSMIGGFTGINKDVPPYMLARGPSIIRSINLVGLRRAKFSRDLIESIKQAHKLLYMSDLNTAQAVAEIKKLKPSKELDHLVEFIQTSKRGICKYKHTDDEYFE